MPVVGRENRKPPRPTLRFLRGSRLSDGREISSAVLVGAVGAMDGGGGSGILGAEIHMALS
jgi:hypothetical protein